MRSFCSALSIGMPLSAGGTLYELGDRLKAAVKGCCKKQSGRQEPAADLTKLRWASAGMPCGPAQVHATTPGGLTQAHQTLRRGLGFGTGRRCACAIFEIGDMRYQRLLAEEPAEQAGAIVQFQVSERIGHIAGMTEGNDATGHHVADFIDPGADRRFDMFATLCIGKSFPVAPSLHHEKSSICFKKASPETRQVMIGFAASTGPVDKSPIAAAIRRK